MTGESGFEPSLQASSTRRRQLVIALAGLAVIVLVSVVAFSVGRYSGRGDSLSDSPAGGDARVAQAVQPFHLTLAAGEAVELEARGFREYRAFLPPPERDCQLDGRVVGISGGDKDFDLLVLSDDDYQNWMTDHAFHAYWQSGVVTVQTISQLLRAPGSYHLVVSNKFSLLTAKAVTISAEVTCPS